MWQMAATDATASVRPLASDATGKHQRCHRRRPPVIVGKSLPRLGVRRSVGWRHRRRCRPWRTRTCPQRCLRRRPARLWPMSRCTPGDWAFSARTRWVRRTQRRPTHQHQREARVQIFFVGSASRSMMVPRPTTVSNRRMLWMSAVGSAESTSKSADFPCSSVP